MSYPPPPQAYEAVVLLYADSFGTEFVREESVPFTYRNGFLSPDQEGRLYAAKCMQRRAGHDSDWLSYRVTGVRQVKC